MIVFDFVRISLILFLKFHKSDLGIGNRPTGIIVVSSPNRFGAVLHCLSIAINFL